MIYKRESYESNENSFKWWKRRSVFLLFIGIFLMMGITGCGESSKYIKIIKEGAFNSYPDTKIGPAFDKFFGDLKWKYFESKDERHIVEVTGELMYHNLKTDAELQFEIYSDDTFELTYLEIAEVPQNGFMLAALIEDVIEEYNK